MTTYVTIYDTNAEKVATETRSVLVSGGDPDVPPEYEDQPVRALDRLALASKSDVAWTRPNWLDDLAKRLEPRAADALNFASSWVILRVIDVKPPPGRGQKLASDHDGGVPDLEAGTITYTWALVDLDEAETAAEFAARKVDMLTTLRARFRAVRDQGTTIDFGGGAVAIQTTEAAANDIQRLHDDLRLRAAGGEENPTQDIATSNYVVVPGVTEVMAGAMREAVATHWRATWARDAAIAAAIIAASDHAALDLINIAAGSIDGAGTWPA